MNDALRDRLFKITRDLHVFQVDLAFKCKTKDGMLYTLDVHECRREDCPEGILFADWLDTQSFMGVMRLQDIVEDVRTAKFYLSEYESAAIRKDEIIRIWADIDCGHHDDGAQLVG
jgi:hypothetical protein